MRIKHALSNTKFKAHIIFNTDLISPNEAKPFLNFSKKIIA